MTRRITGIGAALLLALVGTVALVSYVSTAEERALAGEQLVEVHIVSEPLPAGTPGEDITEQVTTERVPAKVRARGAVADLSSLAGLVTAVDLVPGEQLLAERFVERTELTNREAGVEVPDGMLEITIESDAQRAVGGLPEPGQTVAVFASFDPFQLGQTLVEVDGETVVVPSAVADTVDGSTSHTTDLLLRQVLVTAVQQPGGRLPDDGGQRLTTAPGSTIYLTLALEPLDAERLVFTAEFGNIWFAIDRETVPDDDLPGQTRGSVLADQTGSP